jgi:hypothetical protein
VLIEQLQNMQALLEARNERRNEKRLLQSLSTQEERLSGLLARWQGLAQMATTLGYDEKIIQDFHTEVRAISERFEQGIQLQLADIRYVQETLAKVEDDLRTRWNDQKQHLKDDVLLARARIAFVIGEPQVRMMLQRTFGSINNLLDLPLPSANQYRALEQAWLKLQEELAEALPDMSPQVQIFLEKLATGQATLNDLTQEVFMWCSQQGLLEKITLRFTGG